MPKRPRNENETTEFDSSIRPLLNKDLIHVIYAADVGGGMVLYPRNSRLEDGICLEECMTSVTVELTTEDPPPDGSIKATVDDSTSESSLARVDSLFASCIVTFGVPLWACWFK